jgi:hypothetical protein
MKTVKWFFPLILISSLLTCCTTSNNEYDNHENKSKLRYEEMQKRLDVFVEKGDTNGMRLLSAQLDAQLKIEDFLIKFRQVDHIKFTLSSPLITGLLTALVSIITTLLTIFIKQRQAKTLKQ